MNTRVGVCWFDDPSLAADGWSSIAGGEAKRIRGYGELESDVLWVTNIDYRTYRNLNLGATGSIYDAQYFRTSLKTIASELSLDDAPDQMVERISAVLSRVAELGNRIFGVSLDRPGYRYTNLIRDVVKPPFARKRPDGPFAAAVVEASRQSFQANQAMFGMRKPEGSQHHTFIFPRGAYADYILSRPYPVSTTWRELKQRTHEAVFGVNSDGSPVKGSKAVRERLLEIAETQALLLRIQVTEISDFHRPFATFGAGAEGPRRWAALPEVLALSRFARVVITGGFYTDAGYLQMPEAYSSWAEEYSYARGLLAENAWMALSTPPYGRNPPSALDAYMRAYDRVACLGLAEQFASHGYVVGSYGAGRVVVFVRPGELPHAARIAIKVGAIAPLSALSQSVSTV